MKMIARIVSRILVEDTAAATITQSEYRRSANLKVGPNSSLEWPNPALGLTEVIPSPISTLKNETRENELGGA